MHAQALRYLVAVAEEGHFGRAAARMHVSQPSVSQAVSRLERQFGAQLLDRSGPRVVPTAAGERVLDEVRAALLHLDRALQAADAGAQAASLRIACTGFASMWLTTQLLTPYREAHPEVGLTVAELDVPAQARALISGDIDLAVGEPLAPHPRLLETTIREDRCAIWMSEEHELAVLDEVPLSRLAGIPLADGEPDIYPVYGHWVRRTLEGAGVTPTFAPPTSDTPSAISRIIDGSMVSLSCDMLAEGAIPGLAIRPVRDEVRWRWVTTRLLDGGGTAGRAFTVWARRLAGYG
jgi:DNA-binding transcriptional LysR family regulator